TKIMEFKKFYVLVSYSQKVIKKKQYTFQMLPRVNRRAPQPDVDSPIVMPSLFIDSPVGESPTYSDLEEEPMAPLLLPKPLIKQAKKKTENIALKYPIDIKNLIPREVLVHDDFGSSKQTVY